MSKYTPLADLSGLPARSVMLELEHVFDFGKHKGAAVEDVIQEDPDYLEWLVRNYRALRLSLTVRDFMAESLAETSQEDTDHLSSGEADW